jgi:hypothetical protein
MASFVQALQTASTSATTGSAVITLTANTTLGNMVVVIIGETTVRSIFSFVDSKGNTWYRLSGTSLDACQIWACITTTRLVIGDTITITPSGSTSLLCSAAEFLPFPVASVDATNRVTGTTAVGALPTPGSITNVRATSLLLMGFKGAYATGDLLNYTQDGSWTTVINTQHGTQAIYTSLAYRDVSSINTYTHTPSTDVGSKAYIENGVAMSQTPTVSGGCLLPLTGAGS